MKIDNFNDFLAIYRIVANYDLQSTQSSLKILDKALKNFVNNLFSARIDSKITNQFITLLNNPNNLQILKSNEIGDDENFSIEFEALKESFNTEYKVDDDDEDTIDDGETALKLLEDRLREMSAKKFKTNPQASTNNQPNEPAAQTPASNINNNPSAFPLFQNARVISVYQNRSPEVLRVCLEQNKVPDFHDYPHDVDDITRTIQYLETYLAQRNKTCLTEAEKNKVGILSTSWKGIMDHIEELRAAVINGMPADQLDNLLHDSMNLTKLSTLTSDEKDNLEQFLNDIDDNLPDTKTIDLTNIPIHLANHMIFNLYNKGYHVYFNYDSPNSRIRQGTSHRTVGKRVNLLEKSEYNFLDKSLYIRKDQVLQEGQQPKKILGNPSLIILRFCLETDSTPDFKDHPRHAADLKEVITFLEEFLQEQKRNDLTDEEKAKVSSLSPQWHGIINHLTELRQSVKDNIDPQLLEAKLQESIQGKEESKEEMETEDLEEDLNDKRMESKFR